MCGVHSRVGLPSLSVCVSPTTVTDGALARWRWKTPQLLWLTVGCEVWLRFNSHPVHEEQWLFCACVSHTHSLMGVAPPLASSPSLLAVHYPCSQQSQLRGLHCQYSCSLPVLMDTVYFVEFPWLYNRGPSCLLQFTSLGEQTVFPWNGQSPRTIYKNNTQGCHWSWAETLFCSRNTCQARQKPNIKLSQQDSGPTHSCFHHWFHLLIIFLNAVKSRNIVKNKFPW